MENNGTFDEFMLQNFEKQPFKQKQLKLYIPVYKKFISAMFSRRYQDTWKFRVNNASLLINPDQSDVQNIYSFCEHFNDHLSEFVTTSMNMQKAIRFTEPALIVDTEENLAMVIEILNEQKFIFLDVVNETKNSYKGYISWLMIATYNQLYLIDGAKLHDKCFQLKSVLYKKDLIKFMHDCQQVLNALKRDFQMFIPNIFDLEVFQRYLQKQRKVNSHSRIIFKNFIASVNPSCAIGIRPIKPVLLAKIQQYYQNEMNLLMGLDKFFSTADSEYQCYAYFNHYEFLLKSYFHQVPTVQQLDEFYKMRDGYSNNVFKQYQQHQEVNLMKQVTKQNYFWMKDQEEEELAELLCDWREHIAKMKDINPDEVISYETLSNLIKTKVTSILQISELCSSHSQHLIYSLSLQQFQQIFELIQLHKDQKEEGKHQLIIPRRLPYFKANEQKPIKELFEQLKFTDIGNDWLNKKNDDSVKLYKQIVSINQFDNSVIGEYLKEITTGNQSGQNLNIEDINRYVKYAECFRNGNHKKLQQLHKNTKNRKHSWNQVLHDEFQENFAEDEDSKTWEYIENQINFPTMETINQIKSTESLTSLKSLSNFDIHSCKTLIHPKSSNILKQTKLNSLRQLESPSFGQKVDPLPENIEAIYLQAAKAKKNYVAKGQKKNNKATKKQNKTKTDSCSGKKEEEFVPKKEEIFNLFFY